jgi:hypothetical protein
MLSRLGNVLYWIGVLLSSLLGAIAAYFLFSLITSPQNYRYDMFIFATLFAILSITAWFAGRALRYILSGNF